MAESLTPFYTQIDRVSVDRNDIRERRRRYLVRWTSVKAERGRQWPKWIDLADHFLPERGRFLATDHNAPKSTSKIQNNSTTRYARALAAGLMSGVTSPARPWFNLTLPDPDIAAKKNCCAKWWAIVIFCNARLLRRAFIKDS